MFETKDGRWRGSITEGYTPEGKQRKRWVSGRTQGEVIEKLNKIRHLAGSDIVRLAERLTVEQWLRRIYELRRPERRPKTLRSYDHYLRHILPEIGHVPLQKLTSYQVRRLHSKTAGLSPSVRQHIHDFLNSSFKEALRYELVEKNPVAAVERPKGGVLVEPQVWNRDQIVAFLEASEGHRLHAAFHLLLSLGLRIGELLALRWDDLDGNRLRVQRTLTVDGGTVGFGPPKTRNSTRDVYLSDDILAKLEAHRSMQDGERAITPRWSDEGLIFPSSVGSPLRPENFWRVYKRLVKVAGVPQVRVHDLRHTYITMARDAGLDAEVIANRVGHDVRMTMAVYSKVTEERKRKAALSLDELMRRSAP